MTAQAVLAWRFSPCKTCLNTRKGIFSNRINVTSCKFMRPLSVKSGMKYEFPWNSNEVDVLSKDKIIHRIVGLFMFRRALKHAKYSFNSKEFAEGVKEAVKVISNCITKQDSEQKLQYLLGPALHRQFRLAFELLGLENRKIFLHVDAIGELNISGARFVLGEAAPGDEYIFKTLGQRVILSKTEIEEFEEEKPNDGFATAFLFGKQFGQEAILKKIRFQFDVHFQTFERFLVHSDEEKIEISNDQSHHKTVNHKWRFETPLELNSNHELELDWTIVDVDDHLRRKYKLEETTKNEE